MSAAEQLHLLTGRAKTLANYRIDTLRCTLAIWCPDTWTRKAILQMDRGTLIEKILLAEFEQKEPHESR